MENNSISGEQVNELFTAFRIERKEKRFMLKEKKKMLGKPFASASSSKRKQAQANVKGNANKLEIKKKLDSRSGIMSSSSS